MDMQEMEIVIDKEGKIVVKVTGAQGAECLALTKNLEETTGSVEERIYTAEFYGQAASVKDHQRLSQK